ncbi:MAG: VCBS repeat-containing protein [Desulfuromonadales bacterium]
MNKKTAFRFWSSRQRSLDNWSGTAIAGGGLIYTEPNTNWKIVAAADFNCNGKAELLWWNSTTGQVAIGQTNGTNASTANLIWTEPNTDWRIVGAGDLDGDGKADIIWHNKTTGQIYGMQTNGSSVTNGAMKY